MDGLLPRVHPVLLFVFKGILQGNDLFFQFFNLFLKLCFNADLYCLAFLYHGLLVLLGLLIQGIFPFCHHLVHFGGPFIIVDLVFGLEVLNHFVEIASFFLEADN